MGERKKNGRNKRRKKGWGKRIEGKEMVIKNGEKKDGRKIEKKKEMMEIRDKRMKGKKKRMQ